MPELAEPTSVEDIELPDPPVPRQTDTQSGPVEEFEINKILRARYNKEGKLEYLVDWKGYPASARTYEPIENLNEAAKEYVSTHKIPITGHKQRHL